MLTHYIGKLTISRVQNIFRNLIPRKNEIIPKLEVKRWQ